MSQPYLQTSHERSAVHPPAETALMWISWPSGIVALALALTNQPPANIIAAVVAVIALGAAVVTSYRRTRRNAEVRAASERIVPLLLQDGRVESRQNDEFEKLSTAWLNEKHPLIGTQSFDQLPAEFRTTLTPSQIKSGLDVRRSFASLDDAGSDDEQQPRQPEGEPRRNRRSE